MDEPAVVLTEQHEHTLVIRIDRPAKRNAINAAVTRQLSAALDRLDEDPDLWVGVLTGSPTVFSAGSDLRDGSGEPTVRGGEYGLIRRRRVKPLIAAVEGPAFGGGFEIALACDLVVAARTARFALPETRRGVVASSGALFRVTRALPVHLAKEILIAGAELDAERAHQFGLVNRVAEAGHALAGALDLAREVEAGSPVAVQATLAALAGQLDAADDAGWQHTGAAVARVMASADLREGVAAFFERRTPRWTGQ